MKISKCLGCYEPLKKVLPGHYHPLCSKKLFGTSVPPLIDFGSDQLEELALKSINQHLAITGVQAKISVHMKKYEDDPVHRLMITDLWGNFILKPSSKAFPSMAVVEDATMHMAHACGLIVAKHGLIQFKTGELAYVTKRFDRPKKGKKIAVEDFCQLSGLLTESKYHSSLEKAGKIILKFSTNSGLDAVTFFDLVLFCFITGNSDMHLKNFSLMRTQTDDIILTPFYDLLATQLLLPEDKEETALSINGKKSKLKKRDFLSLGKSLNLIEKVMEKSFERILNHVPDYKLIIQKSFLANETKKKYLSIIESRAKRLKG